MQLNKIVVLGSGNVATHLSKAFFAKGLQVSQIYSRTLVNAQALADEVNAEAVDDMKKLNSTADLYLVCLSDSVMVDVLNELDFKPKLIAHTAGSISIDVLKQFKHHGVLYPLQSFSKQRDVDMKEVPFCIEANSTEVKKVLWELAELISDNVRQLTSKQRKQCHVAGVLVNNFVNHLYGLGADVLAAEGISFDILQPIILETAKKVQELHPDKAQTGPAIRRNTEVIDEHVEMMKAYGLDNLYRALSNSIMKKIKD